MRLTGMQKLGLSARNFENFAQGCNKCLVPEPRVLPPVLSGELPSSEHSMESDLQTEIAMLASTSWTKDLMEAQEEDRRRISQELHDDLGQRLALLEIKIDQLEVNFLPAEVAKGLKNVKELIGEMDRDIHRICYELYPVVLQKLGLVTAMRGLCQDFSEISGMSITFDHENIPKRLSNNVSLCLYRVTQEALHNVSRHAKAKEAKVSLRRSAEGIELVVLDAGRGFDPFQARARKGLGLTTMEERIRSAGGRCFIRSSPGLGTEVKAIVYRHY
jgi:signal transduction histidine kinase